MSEALVEMVDDSNNQYEEITLEQMQDMLAHVKGAKIVTLISLTAPDFKAKHPFHEEVKKLARVNGIVNYNYANAVNRRRVKEGKEADFIAQPRKWGTRLPGLPFVHHIKQGVSKLYLEMKVERSLNHLYVDCRHQCEVPTDSVRPYLNEKRKTKSQDVEGEVVNRDYDVNNILAICIDGKNYILNKG